MGFLNFLFGKGKEANLTAKQADELLQVIEAARKEGKIQSREHLDAKKEIGDIKAVLEGRNKRLGDPVADLKKYQEKYAALLEASLAAEEKRKKAEGESDIVTHAKELDVIGHTSNELIAFLRQAGVKNAEDARKVMDSFERVRRLDNKDRKSYMDDTTKGEQKNRLQQYFDIMEKERESGGVTQSLDDSERANARIGVEQHFRNAEFEGAEAEEKKAKAEGNEAEAEEEKAEAEEKEAQAERSKTKEGLKTAGRIGAKGAWGATKIGAKGLWGGAKKVYGAGKWAHGQAKDSNFILGRENIVGASMFIVLAALLWFLDSYVFLYNGLDVTKFLQLISISGSAEFLSWFIRIFLNGAVLTILIAYGVLNFDEIHLMDYISFALLVWLGSALLLFGGLSTLGGLVHVIFAFIIYSMVIVPYFGDKRAKANFITAIVLFFDFFGYGLLALSMGNQLITNRLIVPLWFYFVVWLTWKTKKHWSTKLLIVGIIAINVFYFTSAIAVIDDGLASGLTPDQITEAKGFFFQSLGQMKDTAKSIITLVVDNSKQWFSGRLDRATGGYGKEEGPVAPKGLVWETGNDILVFGGKATIYPSAILKKAEGLRGERIKINPTCRINNQEAGVVEIRGKVISIDELFDFNTNTETITCKLSADSKIEPAAVRGIEFFVSFTNVIQKNQEVEVIFEQNREDIDEIISQPRVGKVETDLSDPFSFKFEKNNQPLSSTGPIYLTGDDLSNKHVEQLGLKLENVWTGEVAEIGEIIVKVPEGTSWGCAGDLFEKVGDSNSYTATLAESENFGDALLLAALPCLWTFDDVTKALGGNTKTKLSLDVELEYTYSVNHKVRVKINPLNQRTVGQEDEE